MSYGPIDQSDFMRLFVRYERDLRVFARSLLPNWPAVDDALQEASVVMWKKLNQLEQEELYDLSADPGETKNVIAQYPEVVAQLRKNYDQWWIRMQPGLVNEDADQSPAK